MDQLPNELSILGLCCLAVMTVVVVAFTRKLLTFFFPSLEPIKMVDVQAKTYAVRYGSSVARFYNELGLYLLPYVWAAIFALATNEFLFGQVRTYVGRLFLSFMVATFSATFFRAVKKSIPHKLGVEVAVADTVLEQLEEKKEPPQPPSQAA